MEPVQLSRKQKFKNLEDVLDENNYVIIPIFKKGSRLIVSNYRPISLLSNLNKILEKIVHTRVHKFLEDAQSVYSLQFDFRKKHSTNHALIDITETIRQALANKKMHVVFLLTFKKHSIQSITKS